MEHFFQIAMQKFGGLMDDCILVVGQTHLSFDSCSGKTFNLRDVQDAIDEHGEVTMYVVRIGSASGGQPTEDAPHSSAKSMQRLEPWAMPDATFWSLVPTSYVPGADVPATPSVLRDRTRI